MWYRKCNYLFIVEWQQSDASKLSRQTNAKIGFALDRLEIIMTYLQKYTFKRTIPVICRRCLLLPRSVFGNTKLMTAKIVHLSIKGQQITDIDRRALTSLADLFETKSLNLKPAGRKLYERMQKISRHLNFFFLKKKK